ncbi:MAG: metal-dependent hydrolase [Clostridium sp.]|nr:metal-dependent hydrolase [Clostridium sp.]
MKGKEHMIIGTVATATMGVGLFMNDNIGDIVNLAMLISGGFIGSYMPDIDSHSSKASQAFNKIIMILMLALAVGYGLGLALSVDDILNVFKYTSKNYIGLIFFCVNVVLGKLSPHRMFTHKILGVILFCSSVFLIDKYLALGFTTGYILHIICDRFSPKGKNLRFFEFKLPFMNSRNKVCVDW